MPPIIHPFPEGYVPVPQVPPNSEITQLAQFLGPAGCMGAQFFPKLYRVVLLFKDPFKRFSELEPEEWAAIWDTGPLMVSYIPLHSSLIGTMSGLALTWCPSSTEEYTQPSKLPRGGVRQLPAKLLTDDKPVFDAEFVEHNKPISSIGCGSAAHTVENVVGTRRSGLGYGVGIPYLPTSGRGSVKYGTHRRAKRGPATRSTS